MNRWEKLSVVLLRLIDSARGVEGAIKHISSNFGRAGDTLERLERLVEETHASHQKANRQYIDLDARVTHLERSGPHAAE